MSKKIQSTYCPKKVLNIELNIGERYNVLEKIGQGSFGDIYKAFDTQRN
jgi:serine/threonine protein kinase